MSEISQPAQPLQRAFVQCAQPLQQQAFVQCVQPMRQACEQLVQPMSSAPRPHDDTEPPPA